MQIDPAAAKDVRAAAEVSREGARSEAAAHGARQSDLARDQRVQEAKSSDASRPTVAEKRADRKVEGQISPPTGRTRPASGSRILDVLA
jgi:hypothetical protein